MFLNKIFGQHSLNRSSILLNFTRAVQHQKSIRKPVENYPTQNRKPKFDAIHFEESLKPHAEDVTTENQYEKLSNMVLPLANLSYDEQIKIKQDIVEQSFHQISQSILWDKYIDSQVLKYVEFKQGPFCHVEPIVPSSITENYRCKDDLSCGYGFNGEKTVGFYINSKNAKTSLNTLCIPPIHLKSMKPKHRLAVKHFDRFLKQHPLSVCEHGNILKKDQYWRSITMKSNEKDDLIIKQDLVNYFVDGPGNECDLKSIYFQSCSHQRCTSEQNPFELIHGDEFIYENYHDKTFRISPESFLPVNKISAESIYSSTLKQAEIDENTIVLDVGSGIGVYSILASPIAKKIYAIDPSAFCVEDGKFNAKLNQCRDNIEWICGFAESNLHRILKKIGDLHSENSRIVTIINPSRYSLTNRTTSILRTIQSIDRIFYILCKPEEQAMHNFYELATGQRSKLKPLGRPFVPTTVYPFDLLPHTTQAEVLVKCIRM